jgi:hypothetical protein
VAAIRDVTTVGADTAALEERTRAAAITTALAGPLFAWVYTALKECAACQARAGAASGGNAVNWFASARSLG